MMSKKGVDVLSREIEIEFKNIVSRAEFEQLSRHFNVTTSDFALQHNHYFDTPSFMLKEKGCALRIREKDATFTLTLKQPHTDGLLETHQALTARETNSALADKELPSGVVTRALQAMDIPLSTLHYLGRLSTTRAELPYRDGTLAFDRSEYLQIEDHELEYEVSERTSGEENFKQLLASFNIPRRPSKNKVQRFFDQKNREQPRK